MRISQRQATIAVFAIQIAGIICAAGFIASSGGNLTTLLALLAAAPIVLALLASYWRGWDAARILNLLLVTMLVAGPLIHPATARSFSPVLFVPPALALVLANHRWIAGAAVGVIAVALIRAGGQGPYAELDDLAAYFVAAGSLVVGRLIADTSQRIAQHSLLQADMQRQHAEQQALALAQQAGELAQHNAQQQQLLALVSQLETPVIRLAQGMLLAPLVGTFDPQRFQSLTGRLLQSVHEQRARLVVLDITGNATIDGSSAHELVQLANTLRLLGCTTAISGITGPIAASLVAQSASLDGLLTVRTPEDALAHFTQLAPPPAA